MIEPKTIVIHPGMAFIRTMLKGAGQVMFQGNTMTGLFFLLGILWGAIAEGRPSVMIGALVGLIAGIILTPVGMILGSFLGAFLFELYYTRKGSAQALKAAIGSFLGVITGTGLKTIVSVIILWKIFVFAF